MTAIVTQTKPVYETLAKTELLKFIEKNLDVPVALVSYGPTAKDKKELCSLI